MSITPEQIKTLMRLSRIHCTPEEEDALRQDLEKILLYIEQLNRVDTTNVPPCSQVISSQLNVWVDDIPSSPLPRDLFFVNAPESISGMLRVPLTVNQESSS